MFRSRGYFAIIPFTRIEENVRIGDQMNNSKIYLNMTQKELDTREMCTNKCCFPGCSGEFEATTAHMHIYYKTKTGALRTKMIHMFWCEKHLKVSEKECAEMKKTEDMNPLENCPWQIGCYGFHKPNLGLVFRHPKKSDVAEKCF